MSKTKWTDGWNNSNVGDWEKLIEEPRAGWRRWLDGFVVSMKGVWDVKPRTYLSRQRAEASQICLCVLVLFMAHRATANWFGLPHVLHTLIHQLLVDQSESKLSMQRGCFYRLFIFEPAEENAQLFFIKARQTAVCQARLTVLRRTACSSVFPA